MIKTELKHKKFAREVVKTLTAGGTQAEAYKKVYPAANTSSAIQQASRLLAKPEIKHDISIILERNHMDKDIACKKLKRMMSAKKSLVVDKAIQQVQDNPTQLEATKTVLRLHGELKSGVNITEDNRQVNISGDELDHRQLKTLTQKLTSIHSLMNKQTPGIQDGEVVDADFSTTDDTMGVDDAVFVEGVEEGVEEGDVSRGTSDTTQVSGTQVSGDDVENESGEGVGV